MKIVEMNNITKYFETNIKNINSNAFKNFFRPDKKKIIAVENISFDVKKGESIAYLGPNGAGKSTTIKMLTGVLVPSSGEITINGLCPYKQRKKNSYQTGVLFGQRSQLIAELPVYNSFELLRYMFSISKKDFKNRLEEYSLLLNIESFLERPVRTLSLGQRMRCEMLAAILHEPEILFLDEPTIGLDLLAKEKILAFIKKMNQEKKTTLLLTTHDFTDIENLCNRLIIIDNGRIIYDGSLRLIREKFATEKKVLLKFNTSENAKRILNIFKKENLINIELHENNIHLSYDQSSINISNLLKSIAGYELEDIIIHDESIESIIKRIYTEGIPEGKKSVEKNKKS